MYRPRTCGIALLLLLVAGCVPERNGASSSDIAQRRHEVDRLLTSDLTKGQKLEKLRQYIPLGTSSREVRELLGQENSYSGEGAGWFELWYDRYFLIVSFDNTDKVVHLHFAEHS